MLKTIFLSNRMKSFYWRTAMMCVAVILGGLATNLDVLIPYVSPVTIGLLGLILGEVSKGINNYFSYR